MAQKFSWKQDIKKVDWGSTLKYNLLRAVSAGIVWGLLMLITNPAKNALPALFAPIFFPVFYLFLVTVVVGVLSLYARSPFPFAEMIAGLTMLVWAFVVAVGDPLIYLLHKRKPDFVPVDQPRFFDFHLIVFVLRDQFQPKRVPHTPVAPSPQISQVAVPPIQPANSSLQPTPPSSGNQVPVSIPIASGSFFTSKPFIMLVAIAVMLCGGVALFKSLADKTTLSFDFSLDGKVLPSSKAPDVRVDGQPFTSGSRIKMGKHELAVQLQNVEPYGRNFWVFYGAKDLGSLPLQTSKGKLVVTVNPSPASVVVQRDGVTVTQGAAPLAVEQLPVGNYTLVVKRADYEEIRTVDIRRQQTTNEIVELNLGKLQLSSVPADAEYEISGNGHHWQGKLPSRIEDVPVGNYSLSATRRDWELNSDVLVTRGGITTNRTEFPYGSIDVTSVPNGLGVSLLKQEKLKQAGLQVTTNILFYDNFSGNSVDSTKWTVSGNDVVQMDQTMKVLTSVTDRGGSITSKAIPISPTGKIIISRRALLHYSNSFFIGQFAITVGALPTFAVRYANMSYADSLTYMPRFGFFLTRNDARPDVISNRGDVSAAITPFWDTWFDEKVVYDPATGNMEYVINDISRGIYNVGILPETNSPTLTLSFSAWGWYTGHQHLIQKLTVSQINAKPIPQVAQTESTNTMKSGKTPAVFDEIKPGQYTLTISDGENDLEADVSVGPNEKAKHDFIFHYGTVQLTSTPPGAAVVRKGKEIGKTPLTLERIPVGESSIGLNLDGYVKTNVVISAIENAITNISIKLISEQYLQILGKARVALAAGQYADARTFLSTALSFNQDGAEVTNIQEEISSAETKAEEALKEKEKQDIVALIKKAITAHGGRDALTQYSASRQIANAGGKLKDGTDYSASITTSIQSPDKIRIDEEMRYRPKTLLGALSSLGLQVTVNGQAPNQEKVIHSTVCVNGSDTYSMTDGMIQSMSDQLAQNLRNDCYFNDCAKLVPLLDGSFQLEKVAAATSAIKVKKQGRPDFTLFFSDDTGLMAGIEYLANDTSGNGKIRTTIRYSGYSNVSGVMLPTRYQIEHNGIYDSSGVVQQTDLRRSLPDQMFQLNR